jgi:hypothetical protein
MVIDTGSFLVILVDVMESLGQDFDKSWLIKGEARNK